MKSWKQKINLQFWRPLTRLFYFPQNFPNPFRFLLFTLLVSLAIPATVMAGGLSSSTNYEIGEAYFGSGGQLNACSSSYCAKTSAGELTVGPTSSANYQAHAGFNTDRTPYIQIDVTNTNTYLGSLDPLNTKTTTATFSVEAYLSHGYTVVNASGPPTNETYTMQSLTSPTSSQVGVEQFGINLVANTVPTAFGANPQQDPDSTFSFGTAAPGYNTPNLYQYNQGDEIAYSDSDSSFTTYTVSYIFNISNVTPGGFYTFYHVLVATGTF